MKLLMNVAILLNSSKALLSHPAKNKPHPLANKLNLLVCVISGKIQELQIFQQRAFESSRKVGIPRQ